MIRAVLIRQKSERFTTGNLIAYDGYRSVFSCLTLELPYLENKRMVSAIPDGVYYVVPRTSDRFGQHFHIKDVPGRDLILFHAGNWLKDTNGCILVGQTYGDLNKDGIPEVLQSAATMRTMNKALVGGFKLQVLSIEL
jgi:hypothetical protein